MPAFLTARLAGAVALDTVFWRDMLFIGTALNAAFTAAAVAILLNGYSDALGLLVNFLPVPWNLLLLVAVWRSAEREGGPAAATAKLVGVAWFAVMIVL